MCVCGGKFLKYQKENRHTLTHKHTHTHTHAHTQGGGDKQENPNNDLYWLMTAGLCEGRHQTRTKYSHKTCARTYMPLRLCKNCPNIVEFIGAYFAMDCMYIAVELCEFGAGTHTHTHTNTHTHIRSHTHFLPLSLSLFLSPSFPLFLSFFLSHSFFLTLFLSLNLDNYCCVDVALVHTHTHSHTLSNTHTHKLSLAHTFTL